MKIPKILYHGTSMFRWLSIQRDGIMRCDSRKENYWPTGLVLDPNRTSGYLFFTNSIDDAYKAGLRASLTDMRFYRIEKPDKGIEEMATKYRDLVVLALRTSNIKDRIDIDPEIIGTTTGENTLFYRVKGDIKTKYIFPYRRVDYNTIDKYHLDAMIKIQEHTKNAENLIKQNPGLRNEILSSLKFKIIQIRKEADSLRVQTVQVGVT